MAVKTEKEMIQALMKSVDNSGNIEHCILQVTDDILEQEEIEELTVTALITTDTFDSGAPVIKWFFRDNKKANFTFEKEKRYHVAYDHKRGQIYWYQGGVWYLMANDDDFMVVRYFLYNLSPND